MPRPHAGSAFLETGRPATLRNLGWRNWHPPNLLRKKRKLWLIDKFEIYHRIYISIYVDKPRNVKSSIYVVKLHKTIQITATNPSAYLRFARKKKKKERV